MFGFTIKKSFFDLWDNLIAVALINLGLILLMIFPLVAAPSVAETSPVGGLLLFLLGMVLFFLGIGVASRYARDMANYKRPEFVSFIPYLKETWKFSAAVALLISLMGVLLFVAFPVYGAMGNLFGLIGFALVFWLTILVVLALQYLFPVHAQLGNGLKKSVTKSFLILFDNPGFTVGLALGSLVILALSVFTAFLLPGIGGLLLWHQVGLKLRLYKYDYLEENPEASRKRIPWQALLMEERDSVGKRTFKGMIFPWKE
ncbi:MAG: hypothetical protein ACOC47_05720 [Alkalispirochaetaceae bacterium]